MQENDEKRIERTVVWLDAKLVPRMDGWLAADNCKNRSEFINKALRFYMGYLGTEDNTAYLSQAILTAIQGTLDDNNNRLCRILFKCAVELNMLCHTIAAHFRTDPIHTRELRAYAEMCIRDSLYGVKSRFDFQRSLSFVIMRKEMRNCLNPY